MKKAITAICTVLLFAGCGGSEPAEIDEAFVPPEDATVAEAPAPATPTEAAPVRVAFVTNNASEYWKIAQAGTERAARELGVEIFFRLPSAGTAEQQQQIVQDLITTGVSGIAISPKDPENQTEMLNEVASQVHLITQDSDAPESDRIAYIGTDNYAAGKQAGELVQAALPEGGDLMVFVGSMDAKNAQDRLQGLKDQIADSGHTVIEVRTDEGDRAKAMANAEDALLTHPDIDGMVGLWAYNPPAILNAVQSAGKTGEIAIIGFDEEEETLQGVKDGHIFGTIVQQPFAFGYQSVKLLKELAEGNRENVPEDGLIYIPTLSVTQDRVDDFWANLKETLGQS